MCKNISIFQNPPPIVDLGELGPVRCKRCKAYMNPYMLFIDGGRRFQCVFCGAATDGRFWCLYLNIPLSQNIILNKTYVNTQDADQHSV